MQNFTLEQYQKAYRKVNKKNHVQSALVWTVLYVIISLLLVLINYTVTGFDVLWCQYPIMAWAIYPICMFVSLSIHKNETSKNEALAEKMAKEMAEKEKPQEEQQTTEESNA